MNPDVVIAVGHFVKSYLSSVMPQYRLMKTDAINHPAYCLRGGVTKEKYIEEFRDRISKYLDIKQTTMGDF
ncbi:MAG: hypothetical protein EHM34_09690 [Nitrosopumilales archaeon]|nr:MAG: hypothetical protein EHM34_09690 [Nitrosopumilales archaeon]